MAGNNDAIFNYFLTTAEMIVKHFDDDKDKRNQMLAELEGLVKDNCVHIEKRKKVTETVKELVNNTENLNDPEEIMKSFKEKSKHLDEYIPIVSSHPNLLEYSQQVKEIVNNADGTGRKIIDDEDIEMTQDDINVFDPFTKVRMTNPVKNKACGHVYDHDSLKKVLSMNKNTRCPIVGCINKNPILLENVVQDIVTRKFLHDNPS